MNSGKEIFLAGIKQLADAKNSGQIWLNSVQVVETLLDELQHTAWQARVQQAQGKVTPASAQYLINSAISGLVQAFEGRHPSYAVLSWNTDTGQMKAHIAAQISYWGDDSDVTIDDALPRLLDCCAAAAVFGVESLLPDCFPAFSQTTEEAIAAMIDERHHVGSYLLGMPVDLYVSMLPIAADREFGAASIGQRE